MTTAVLDKTLTLEEVSELTSNDVAEHARRIRHRRGER
ncbi:hypothetical protein SEA_GRUUNAGA_92 [Mycobacterium phage Gruunaga]|uniref:Uncharacterized protein n=1 Tax=Mycobacterium phage Gruunaga TaxID=1897770 RepID=A0A1C9LYY3_9CAUD|nr:hypothetical protein SEA_GRUUNAGA_92 [Mycobacterium phage Gruunaga]